MDRQKMLYIFGAAWLSAALLTWFLYAKTKAPKQDKMVQVVASARDLASGTKIAKGDIKLIPMRELDMPKGAMTKLEDALGRAVVYPVGTNEPVTSLRLTNTTSPEGAAAVIPRGKRAVSIPFTDATGASGLVQPKSRVDVLFTRGGSNAAEAMTVTVLDDIEVMSIGRQIEVPQPTAPGQKAAPRPTNQTATLLVTPEQARKLELARNQGKLSLSLRNPLDTGTSEELAAGATRPKPATLDTIDPELLTAADRRKKKAGPLRASVANRGEWNMLIDEDGRPIPMAKPKPPEKKEPPKPRVVVDVFHGEKHVQEMFQ